MNRRVAIFTDRMWHLRPDASAPRGEFE